MPKQEMKNLKVKMQKVIEHLEEEFIGIRTGRAHPALVNDIKVDYYGAPTAIKQLATVNIPEGRTIVIAPFDKSSLKAVEKGILASNLGVTPQNDGEVIRINLPELTNERRIELTKIVRKYAEEAKVVIRNCRRDSNDNYKQMEKDSKITEDDLRQYLKEVQDVTDDFTKRVDEILKKKEEEIMSVD